MRGTPETAPDWVIKALEEKEKEHAEACREEFLLQRKDWGKDGNYRGGKLLDDVAATALSYANGIAHVWYDPENPDQLHHDNAVIEFNLACYASVACRMEEAKERLRHAIELDKEARKLALEDEDLMPLWDWIGGLK